MSLMESHRSRTLTAAFHAFVAECCRLDASQRPAATDHLITAHPFIRQHLKGKVKETYPLVAYVFYQSSIHCT